MLFVDSNVILDVITADPSWAAWSATQLSLALDAGLVLINAKAASPLGLCKKQKCHCGATTDTRMQPRKTMLSCRYYKSDE